MNRGQDQSEVVRVSYAPPLCGTVELEGAKNAVLVIMASLLLTDGVSTLRRVPPSADVLQMIRMLEMLGAQVSFDMPERTLCVDTQNVKGNGVLDPTIVRTFRASTLVVGPLLARFGHARIAFPGGDNIGSRPIDFHVRAFERMGARVVESADELHIQVSQALVAGDFVLEYPSVGATENIIMASVLTRGTTRIYNAALEPEVLDLIQVLQCMGADIAIGLFNVITIVGVDRLTVVDHAVMYDRLEAGTFMVAAAVTGGTVTIPQAPAGQMQVFIEKIRQMGHDVQVEPSGVGLTISGILNPRAVSFRTMPYPGFPTDLQAIMMVAQLRAQGMSMVYEAVHEQRMSHVTQLQKMGANVTLCDDRAARVQGGVPVLQGAMVHGGDLRAVAALVLAGMCANGVTYIWGYEHLVRGYVDFDGKLRSLGAQVDVVPYETAVYADVLQQVQQQA